MALQSLAELALNSADVLYQSEDFKVIIEQNLDYIKMNSTNQNGFLQTVEVPDAEAGCLTTCWGVSAEACSTG